MSIARTLLAELEQESDATQRVLERVPQKHLSWKPHAKSMSLGQLALHIAMTPGGVAEIACQPSMQRPIFSRPAATSTAQVLRALDESLAKAKKLLGGMDDATATATWRLLDGNRELMALPRVAVLRTIMLNHWYHHRGQLSVYLRELNVPVPSIYGPSADENPFVETVGSGLRA